VSIPDDSSSVSSAKNNRLNVDNPLAVFSASDLDQKIVEFVGIDEGLKEHLVILQRGAQLARDKLVALEDDTALSDEQRTYLQDGEERAGFFGQSKFLKGSLLSACLAGIIQ
jgi:hypothetical protein